MLDPALDSMVEEVIAKVIAKVVENVLGKVIEKVLYSLLSAEELQMVPDQQRDSGVELATSLSQAVSPLVYPFFSNTPSSRGAAAIDSAPQALPFTVPPGLLSAALAVVAASVGLTIAVLFLRRRIINNTLQSRLSYNLLPSTAFDPKNEHIQRFALQLTRTRPAESRLRPRRAASVRIRMVTDGEGKLSYSLSGPERAGSVLRHPTYGQVEVKQVGEAESGAVVEAGAEKSPPREKSSDPDPE